MLCLKCYPNILSIKDNWDLYRPIIEKEKVEEEIMQRQLNKHSIMREKQCSSIQGVDAVRYVHGNKEDKDV